MADLTNSELNLLASIKSQLSQYGLEDLSGDIIRIIQDYGDEMPETINAELRKTETYKKRFAGNETRAKLGLPVLSESEYVYQERQYSEILRSFGQADLATRENYSQFIGGDVSPVELTNRFNLAVERVQKADPALRQQLNKMYPGISNNDLARSLLLGKDGAKFLESKIGQAEILAEASTANLNLQTSATDLQAQGVSRETARKGLQRTAEQLGGVTQAARKFGDKRSAEQIQKEMESENLLGIQSKKNLGLASQARASFQKQTGLSPKSLARKKTGQL